MKTALKRMDAKLEKLRTSSKGKGKLALALKGAM
jgi:hypothetical protein